MTRYGMAVDLTRCIGCNACAMACKVSNNLPKDIWWNEIRMTHGGAFDTSTGEYGANEMVYQPTNCMHCANAACVEVCPTGATSKRDDGIVTVDAEACIGCESCIKACPYDVRHLLATEPEYYTDFAIGDVSAPQHLVDTVGKCDFCAGRVDRGDKPACMELCPGRARYWGDLDDPDSEISKVLEGREVKVLLEEEGTEPSFFYFS